MLDENQLEIVNSNEKNIIVEAGAGSGKAIPNSTIIPTINGMKRVDEIKEGDYLYDREGKPTKVIGVYPQGEKEVYKIKFGDGRSALCCEDHLWNVHKKSWAKKDKFQEMSLKEIINQGIINNNRGANFYIQISKAVEKKEIKYEIPPYIIGAFLANGCCVNHSRLTLSTGNKDIPNICCSFIKGLKYEKGYNKYKWQFYFLKNNNKEFLMTKEIFSKFEDEILQYSNNKKIPNIYKIGSIKQRLELLQGLFDGDGSIEKSNGTIKYTSTSYELIKDIQEVLFSLGYVSKLYKEKRKYMYKKECYYILVNIPNYEKEKIFLLKRKKDIALKYKKIKQKHDYDRTSIRSIEKMNYKEKMTCFYVDNKEHLFLMNDYIVTHNTRVLIERIRKLINDGIPPSNIVAISFTNMAAEEMKERLIDVKGIGDCFIGTIHSFANKIFKNSNEDYKLYTDEIENQFMNVLISLYAKNLTMDRYLIYKDLKHKIDLGTIDESELNATMLPSEMFEINTFFGEKISNEYQQTVKT